MYRFSICSSRFLSSLFVSEVSLENDGFIAKAESEQFV